MRDKKGKKGSQEKRERSQPGMQISSNSIIQRSKGREEREKELRRVRELKRDRECVGISLIPIILCNNFNR